MPPRMSHTAHLDQPAVGAEGLALGQLWRVPERREPTLWDAPMPGIRLAASSCLVVLFLSGGYLTGRAGLWSMAWPKVAVGIIVTFGALAGLSSQKLKEIRRAYTEGELRDPKVLPQLRAPFLTISLGIRTSLVLAAVWLMTAKPSFVASFGVVLALVSISWGVAALIRPRAKTLSALAADPNLQRSAR